MKLLVVSPHLSTGGCPQYTLEYLRTHMQLYSEIKLVEFSNFSSDFVVQKNKIIDLIGKDNLYTLGNYGDDDTAWNTGRGVLLEIISDYKPDIVWMAEIPESYEYRLPPDWIMQKLYSPSRSYKIIETTHNNSFDFSRKRYIPDSFMFCDDRHIAQSANIQIPKTVWQYPIVKHDRPDRADTLRSLGLDPAYLHVLNVGLLCPNKNQKYIYDLASELTDQKVMFHFIGNNCFLNDTGITPTQFAQTNCKWWGERSDVDVFMSCMDIYLFPSKKELNPLTVKESLSWDMQVVVSRDEYVSQYTDMPNFNILQDINIKEFILGNIPGVITPTPSVIRLPGHFLVICSFYNNTAEHIRQTFANVLNQTHQEWTMIVADDFSTNDCKSLLKIEFDRLNHPNIIMYEPKFKRELYVYQNLFRGMKYDYVFDLDSDDIISPKMFESYHRHFIKYPEVDSIFSDFITISEASPDKLHWISAVKTESDVVNAFAIRCKSDADLNTATFHSQLMFGHGRCFRKRIENKLNITNIGRTATDSFILFNSLNHGNHLQLPRSLYTWKLRPNSDSSGQQSIEEWSHYNDNTHLAISTYDGTYKCLPIYDDIWLETNALSYSGFTEQSDSIDLITDSLTDDDIRLIHELYPDKHITLNAMTDNCVIVWNKIEPAHRTEVLNFLASNPNIKYSIYGFFDDFDAPKESVQHEISLHHNSLVEMLAIKLQFKYFMYYRHIIISKQ